MKNITKTQTCQTELTTRLNNRALPVVKPKKKRRTRTQLANLTQEERSFIYDRRSDLYKIRIQRKQTKSPYLSDRKLLSFLAPYCVPLETKYPAVKDIFIYNYYTHTKRVASYDELIIQERLKKERLTVNVSKMFHKDDDSQPKYASPNSQKQESSSKVSTVPAKNVPEFNIVNYAKRIWEEEVIKKNKSQYYYKQALRRKLKDFPKTEFALKIWYNSSEATHIREWLNAKDIL